MLKYFKKAKKITHGIMFHHFHDNKSFARSEGSISANELEKIIKFIGRENIINADEYLNKYSQNKLKKSDVCFTFDDALKCQIKIALPILNKYKIKSFFFIQSGIFDKKKPLFEILRFFKTYYFKNNKKFYNYFFKKLGLTKNNIINFIRLNNLEIIKFKKLFPFYTNEDIVYRFIRDRHISSKKLNETILKMLKDKKINFKNLFNKLLMNKKDLHQLKKNGHIVGLHSHNHTNFLENLEIKMQEKEYKKNIKFLSNILRCNKNYFNVMSHPSGSYSKDTLNILKKLNIKFGFKQTMSLEKNKGMKKLNNSSLEIAREDHANIMKLINFS